MKIAVISRTHQLLNYAFTLKDQGHEVSVQIQSKNYRRAWQGLLELDYVKWEDLLQQEDTIILTDSPESTKALAGHPHLWGTHTHRPASQPNITLGAWFDGTLFHDYHWFFPEWGAWVGGQGPQICAAGTLVLPPTFKGPTHVFGELAESGELEGYRGLVQVALDHRDNSIVGADFRAGWLPIHSYLYLSTQEDIAMTLAGGGGLATEAKQYYLGAQVSRSPWPHQKDVEIVPLPGVTSESSKEVMFQNINLEGGLLQSIGTDGSIGVVRGSGNSLQAAQASLLGVAQTVSLPDLQLRTDVGQGVPGILVGLEGLGLW